MHKLYHFPLSPFSRKVRLVLAEKKIEVELVEERYWEERADFMRLNPGGQIPVLRTDKLALSIAQRFVSILRKSIQSLHYFRKGPSVKLKFGDERVV